MYKFHDILVYLASIVPEAVTMSYEFDYLKIHSDMERIEETETSEECIRLKTMKFSCKSDTYHPGHSYAGVIIYQYDGKSEWRTANNTHCKSGYIVIQDTDSENVKKWIGKEPGAVHGAVYRNDFGESVSEGNVVGEGFALRNGKYVKVEKF